MTAATAPALPADLTAGLRWLKLAAMRQRLCSADPSTRTIALAESNPATARPPLTIDVPLARRRPAGTAPAAETSAVCGGRSPRAGTGNGPALAPARRWAQHHHHCHCSPGMKEAGKALRKLPHCPDLPGTWQNSQPGGAGSATEAEPFREPTDAMRSTLRPSQRHMSGRRSMSLSVPAPGRGRAGRGLGVGGQHVRVHGRAPVRRSDRGGFPLRSRRFRE
jgi:hypothetical protein